MKANLIVFICYIDDKKSPTNPNDRMMNTFVHGRTRKGPFLADEIEEVNDATGR